MTATNICYNFVGFRYSPPLRVELHLKPPKFEHIFVAVITFFPLSSVQIIIIPACCLLCVLSLGIMSATN